MDPDARLRKKRREAEMLRDVPPERTLEMGFEMMAFVRALAEAANRDRA